MLALAEGAGFVALQRRGDSGSGQRARVPSKCWRGWSRRTFGRLLAQKGLASRPHRARAPRGSAQVLRFLDPARHVRLRLCVARHVRVWREHGVPLGNSVLASLFEFNPTAFPSLLLFSKANFRPRGHSTGTGQSSLAARPFKVSAPFKVQQRPFITWHDLARILRHTPRRRQPSKGLNGSMRAARPGVHLQPSPARGLIHAGMRG